MFSSLNSSLKKNGWFIGSNSEAINIGNWNYRHQGVCISKMVKGPFLNRTDKTRYDFGDPSKWSGFYKKSAKERLEITKYHESNPSGLLDCPEPMIPIENYFG